MGSMKRLNFTLDSDTVELLESISVQYYDGNKSRAIREALQSLATHVGHDGWVVGGYTPVELTRSADCHTCGTPHGKGEVLFHPVFQRGSSPKALPELPAEDWLDCPDCVQKTSEEF